MLKNVPSYLGRGDPEAIAWLADEGNLESLKEFLASYDLDLNDVAEIWFYNRFFKAEVYERDDKGDFILERESPLMSVKKVYY